MFDSKFSAVSGNKLLFLALHLIVVLAGKTTGHSVDPSHYQYPAEEQVVNKELDSDPPIDYGTDDNDEVVNSTASRNYNEELIYPPKTGLEGRGFLRSEKETYRWKSFNILVNYDDFDKSELKAIHQSAHLLQHVLSSPPCNIHVGVWDKDSKTYGDYIYLKKGHSSGQKVGRHGGRQEIRICPGCVNKCDIVRLFMYALGFVQEHNRRDRDKYIEIFWENIQESAVANFNIEWTSTTLGTEYDEGSVMHYDAEKFQKAPDLVVMQSKRGMRLGCDEKEVLSKKDVAMLRKVYCTS